MKPKLRFHLLPNAHLDPVWLWDWREGLGEGLTTVTTVLNLMDEDPELTFIRGESSIYQHIQKTAPKVFDRILKKIAEGRWDVVGGTYVQPDTNLAATETLCRQFESGLAYFDRELGVRPTVAWQPDSFGHTAGWPNILSSFGMRSFAFTRPSRKVWPLKSPAVWWRGDHRNDLLCYRQHWDAYGSERTNIAALLDGTLKDAANDSLRNVGVLIGLGNHGGGPTRRHLQDVAAWRAAHPEVEVVYSTLHGFFDALRAELPKLPAPIPTVTGEFGYCLRGCYSSVQKFKSIYRQAEAQVVAAESASGIIQTQLDPTDTPLGEAWESILFNSFHDILPGSSIERAMDDQIAWTGLALHHAHKARFAALNQLAAAVDTRVPPPLSPDAPTQVPILVWNPTPRAFSGPVELEASLDYRPMWDYQNRADEVPVVLRDAKGKLIPFQEIATEHSSLPWLPWRKRVVARLDIPAFGWRVVRVGLAEKKYAPVFGKMSATARTGAKPAITNSRWEICTDAKGSLGIKLDGRPFLGSPNRLSLRVVEDPWGSWGGMSEERDAWCLDEVREEWKITQASVIEKGPERARLWTRWQGKNSWCELTFDLNREVPWVTVHGRLLWNERSARLQLVLPSTGPAVCDVPGSVVTRTERGQVPVGRWFTRANRDGTLVGLASDVLSDADFLPKETRLTLARASRYANDVHTGPADTPWQPAVDCGELKFRLCLFTEGVNPDHVADSLLFAPVALPVTPSPGDLPPTGSLARLQPEGVRLLSAEKIDGELKLRVQNRTSKPVAATFTLGGRTHKLGKLAPQQIATQRLRVRPL